jgi:hypothetical protein
LCSFFCSLFVCGSVSAQTDTVTVGGKTLYEQVRNFSLNGGKAEVSQLVLKRDRAVMTFNGTFYFQTPTADATR